MFSKIFLTVSLGLSAVSAQTLPNRYTLILEDPPPAERYASRTTLSSKEAVSYRLQIETKQKALRQELARRNLQSTGSVSTVLNAIFVVAPPERLAELKALPGVKAVIPQRRYRKLLNRATQLLNAPTAWSYAGGVQNAGRGIKIGILDSGIDQTHPAFQDPSLPMPSGFPICSGADCAFTNNKVIVARSYVRIAAAGSSASNPAADSRPDDYSPRDRDGHGTAVASCAAGAPVSGPVAYSGFAPKAYLGNYKIYGSPGLNDGAGDDVILQAIEDAFHDGMDVINFSSGGPAFNGPLESGAVCGNPTGVPCDLVAQSFETLARQGLIIVAAAGNEGYDGLSSSIPGYGTIGTPADAPSVIAVGAVTNSHRFSEVVNAPGAGLQNVAGDPGDGIVPTGSLTWPLVDVTVLGDDGHGCSAFPAGSLVGSIALIQRDNCNFSTKVTNAENAGAVAVILYMSDSSATISPSGLSSLGIPAVMIANSAGATLKTYARSSGSHTVTISSHGVESSSTPNQVAYFSSVGPTTGDAALKPDLVTVGTNVYMSGSGYDLAGALYSADGFVVADGTSFSTPMAAGAAALVKQLHPNFTAAQVKSALVNTASAAVTTDDAGNAVDVRSLGGGELDAGAAAATAVTAEPSNVSFGVLTPGSLPKTQSINITNTGSTSTTLSITVSPAVSSSANVQVDRSSLSLAPGASGTVTVSLSGSVPGPGSYSGVLQIQGSGVSLKVPYLFLVGSSSVANLIPLTGTSFDGTVGGGIPDGIISFKLTDSNGVPVAGVPVSFTARNGSLQQADTVTDAYGIAAAVPVLGSVPGSVSFVASAGGFRTSFTGIARLQPAIRANGVVDSATFDTSRPVAPGSYITIFGTGLSDFTDYAQSLPLPLQIDYAHVTFDVPSAGISVPGRLVYVSPTQINLQVPWELQGQTSAQVKVSIDYSDGNVTTVKLADYVPSLFLNGSIPAALDGGYALITASHPAQRGKVLILYANGLGPVSNQPASGDPAPGAPYATTTTQPVVTIGGSQAQVLYSGLATGFPGLYQLNLIVPSDISAGSQPVLIRIGGQTSTAVSIPVQ